jgi:mRNA interferase RelE/StbE
MSDASHAYELPADETVPADAVRQLRKLPKDTQRRLRTAIETLRSHPRPPGAVKLAGSNDLWRIRVGDFRVVYTITDEALVITVVRVANRREVYRGT